MLTRITATCCPDCGCTDIKDERRHDKHISGHWNEERTFECGRKLTYSPNIGHGRNPQRECTRSEDALKKEAQKKILLTKLKSFMKENDLNLRDLKDVVWTLELES